MNVWVAAARPRTLPAAVTPVLVGTATAENVLLWRAFGALVVALSLQVGVNYANDLFDAQRGIDTAARSGPRRAVSSGDVTARSMRVALAVSLLIGAVAGLLLAIDVGWELIAVGAVCIIAALGYSGGPRPYASAGLGELFVFVFFGLVATIGSSYVQTEEITTVALLAAIPIGLLASAILVANNLRDTATDAGAGKITLEVRLGPTRTQTFYRALVLGSFPWLVLIAGVLDSPWPLLPFLALPLTIPLLGAITRDDPQSLITALTGTARLQLLYGFLLAVGLWIS